MATNRGVAYIKPGVVEVQSIPYPKLKMPKSETDPFGGNRQLWGAELCKPKVQNARGRPHARSPSPRSAAVGYNEVFLECVAPLSTTDFSSFGTATGTRQPGRFPTLLTTE